ncbi:Protein T23F2.5 [Aphelenchoides avenae]|nr:Protein T23F2.5 [Aphelenchus avenae]KAH7720068.1 Protein T23F2.5 [Aphelenchus avenae]
MALTCCDIPKFICSIIIPPIGVFFETGCSVQLALNILLTICGYVPGLIHAIWVICHY